MINYAIKRSQVEFSALNDDNVFIENEEIYENDFYMNSLILLKLNDFVEANKIIDCLIEKEESAKNYCLKAKILYEMKDYENALCFVNKALELDPDCDNAIEIKESLMAQTQ